ncbi:hypothetical protein J2Z44_002061 [Clostridium punense]|uniref:Uncharacterized protein n=1 Tax=Clostridium punense TaxID=1054297 RepID=A0ABS4K4S4_9CLOT|nr:hypothetical protein M918_02170 [Clostridium sp. BL8]MBP2022260.1 hypothetical protein [Clostridium punense]
MDGGPPMRESKRFLKLNIGGGTLLYFKTIKS